MEHNTGVGGEAAKREKRTGRTIATAEVNEIRMTGKTTVIKGENEQ